MSEEPNIEDLVLRWHVALGRGEAPSIEEICIDCPEMETVLEHELIEREYARIGIVEVDDSEPVITQCEPDELVAGDEPVPGYRLLRRIGKGGSGAVWEAIGPGGIPVAIKVVEVTEGLDSSPDVRQRRLDSVRSLELIRAIRHPNILPLFGAWSREGLLIFVMELAERTLHDRLAEAIRGGQAGIPKAELLAYMEQAASGIDFLNQAHDISGTRPDVGVQHGDIKPQNLLLVGGCVKIGDFGQVIRPNDFGRISSGSTASYAPPELAQGTMSSRSDQYALAVSYCMLRGGRLPFLGNPVDVVIGHFRETPDLTMLPEDERPAVAKALSKLPADRWPDCRTFVREIMGPQAASSAVITAGRLPTRRTQRRARLAASLGLVAMVAVLAAVALLRRDEAASGAHNSMPQALRQPALDIAVVHPVKADIPSALVTDGAEKSAEVSRGVDKTNMPGELPRKTEVASSESVHPMSKSDDPPTQLPFEKTNASPVIKVEPSAPAPKIDIASVIQIPTNPAFEKPPLIAKAEPAPAENASPPPSSEKIELVQADKLPPTPPPSEKPAVVASPTPEPVRQTDTDSEIAMGPPASAAPPISDVAPHKPSLASGTANQADNPPPAANATQNGGRAEGEKPARTPSNPMAVAVGPAAAPPPVVTTAKRTTTASVSVLMPSEKAELVVKGEVGRGNPDEWYGPTRVIHTPPMDHADDYIIGAFWLDAAGKPLTKSCKIRLEPGKVYEVDLRPGVPTSKEIVKVDPLEDLSPRRNR